MDKKSAGKTALITGSDSGIGQATAIEFARQGARVALELAEEGINVNSLAPGMVLTPFNQEAKTTPRSERNRYSAFP